MLNERKLTKSELKKREDIIQNMKNNKRELVKRYGKDAEKVMYGRATNIILKQREKLKNKIMGKDKLKEIIKDVLQNPKKADLNKDGKLSNYEKKRGAAIEKSMEKSKFKKAGERAGFDMRGINENDFGGTGLIVIGKSKNDNDLIDQAVEESGFYGIYNSTEDYWFFPEKGGQPALDNLEKKLEKIFIEKGIDASFDSQLDESINEDIDLGHEDNEPHMLKKNLYKIGTYARDLYKMVDGYEYGHGEVDFPHWWQSKIIKAESMISSAKHYLEFELKEPQIDDMVGVAQEEDVLNEGRDKVSIESLSIGNTYKDIEGYPVKVVDISGTGNSWKITIKDEHGKEKIIKTSLDKGVNLYESTVNENQVKVGDKVIGLYKTGKKNPEYKGTVRDIQKNGDIVIYLDKPLFSTGQASVVLPPKDVIKRDVMGETVGGKSQFNKNIKEKISERLAKQLKSKKK